MDQMNKEELSEIVEGTINILFARSDNSDYYQIYLDKRPVSFGGVRLFATVGAAKASMNRQICYNLRGSRGTIPGQSNILKTFKGQKHSKTAKDLIDGAIKSGRLEIKKV